MSFLASRALRSFPRPSIPRRSIVVVANTRYIHASTRRAALSESDHSERPHSDEERKAKIDHHKDDQLSKQKEGKGHWKKELSSNSEAAIKADREELGNVEEDIANLQKETARVAGEEKK
ncbi:MAG: hypothetical protein Q9223_005252 [Gallowayella weberi]